MLTIIVSCSVLFVLSSCNKGGGGDGNDTGTEPPVDVVTENDDDLLEEEPPEELPTQDQMDDDGMIDGPDIDDGVDGELPYDPLCPAGLECGDVTTDGYLGCLVGGEIPTDAPTGCHLLEGGCTGNAGCFYTNDERTESVCVTNCGECPAGLTCSDVSGGYLGCLDGGNIPSSAPTGCHTGTGCAGNATCWYTNEAGTESVCIQNCSPPPPCTPGSCPEGQECVDGSCVLDIGDGPGTFPGITCDLPPIECTGTAAYCGELIQFDPTEGVGYTDYPENGETVDNQYRSWLRRDLVMLIQYATAKVACYDASWTIGSDAPLGLIDMSEQNGAIPGTSIGEPGHPEGTHTNGFDIDVAYYQVGTSDNRARPICDHYEGGTDAYHCTATPHLLDAWRSALFLGALFEHPHIRVVGCDGKAGPILDSAITILCRDGWITPFACGNRALTYEEVNEGRGWYYFHHHHMHVSLGLPDYRGVPGGGAECLVPGCDRQPLLDFLAAFDLAKAPVLTPVGKPHLKR